MTANSRHPARRLLATLLVLTFAFGATASISQARTDIVDSRGWCTLAFPATNLDAKVELALGADLTANPATWVWTDITQFVRHEQRIVISRGRGDEWTQVGPSQAALTLDNSDGRFTRLNPVGAHYGQLRRNTPLRIRVNNGSGYVTRFTGYVTQWPPRWDLSEANQFAPITADGVFRRLGQGDPLQSPLYRSISGTSPASYLPQAYWSLEDGSNATQFASALTTANAIIPSGTVTPSATDTLAGSSPLPQFTSGARATGVVPTYTDTGKWQAMVMVFLPSSLSGSTGLTLLAVRTTSSTIPILTVAANPVTDDFTVGRYDAAGSLVSSSTIPFDSGFPGHIIGNWVWVTLGSENNASGTDDRITARFITLGREFIGIYGDLFGSTGHGLLESVGVNGAGHPSPSGAEGASYGHVSAFVDAAYTLDITSAAHVKAANGFAGEQADDRVKRLCDEEKIPVAITGTTSAAMGVQSPDTLLNLLRECEAADLGVLSETLDGKVGYRTNANRYNAAAYLTLNYTSGQVQEPWAPADDDQRIRNDITVTRSSGSSARSEDATSIANEGRYRQPHTANVESDSQLANTAGWLLHLGTWDELRYPAIGFFLHRHTSLINTWQAGDPLTKRVDISNLPSPVPPTTTQQSIEGYTETIGQRDWFVALNAAPYGPYNTVGVYGADATVSRYDSAHSTLAAGVSDTATALTVVTEADHALWITGSGTGTLLNDTFTRSVSSGWGTSNSGHTYALVGGAASGYSTNGSRGEILIDASTLRRTVAGPSATDGIIRGTLVPGVVATGNSFELGLSLRVVDASNRYDAEVRFQLSGALLLRFVRTLAGSAASIADVALSGTYTAATLMKLVFEIAGSTLRAKAWKTTDTEPVGWQLEFDDTNITGAGQGGCTFRVQASNTNVPFTARYDDLLYVPQLPFDVGVSGIRLPCTAISSAVLDPFTRSETSTWGAEPVAGQVYDLVGGALSDYNVSGTRGQMLADVANVARTALLNVGSTNGQAVVHIPIAAVATGADYFVHLFLRATDASNGYFARIRLDTAGNATLNMARLVSGGSTLLGSGVSLGAYSAAQVWGLRFDLHGTQLQARAWNTSSSEPQHWLETVTDTVITSGTKVACRLFVSAGNTNVPLTQEWDNFEVPNPQRFTVQRNADGIDKALAAGAQVRLWKPARYGL